MGENDDGDASDNIELPESTPLFFNDGFVFDADYVVVASQMVEFSDSAVSRVSLIKGARSGPVEWLHLDFEDAATSVTGLVDERGIRRSFFLGMYGKVLAVGGGEVAVEEVPYDDRNGRLLRIRSVGQSIVACGMSGQLLVRGTNGWRRFDGGLLGTDTLDFEDIDGTSMTDLYAVGVGGVIFHFDGVRWRRLDSPTNRSLSNVRCVCRDEVFICGDGGALLRGSARLGWETIRQADEDDLWGLAVFDGRPYVSSSAGLFVLDDKDLIPIDLGIPSISSFNRIDASEDGLWSFGIEQIAWFDRDSWQEIGCPANA